MGTLCAMFDSVDRDVVHMVLIEGCGGNMESAVEALLTMTGGVSDAKPQKASAPKQKVISVDKSPASHSQQQLTNLPADFLRPPSYFLQRYENDHEFDAESAEQRQIIEDEMFAKAIFEDSLFAADLQANPEWVLEELNESKKKKKSKINVANKSKKFSWRNQEDAQFQQTEFNNADNVDPSDLNARKLSFKQRFDTLGSAAKQKLGVLAHKLQRNKQESKMKESGHQYRNVLTSLDDEALIDVDDHGNNAVIENASEDNRGTYQAPIILPPQKPDQSL